LTDNAPDRQLQVTFHPYERMFSAMELRSALGDCGLEALHFQTKNPLGLLPYLIIVARKR